MTSGSIAEHYRAIRELRQELEAEYPDGVFLARDGGDGAVTTADHGNAARCIVEGTHKLASEAQINAYREDQARRARTQTATENLFGRGIRTVAVIGGGK